MPIADASWLIALFNNNDARHGDALESARPRRRYRIPHVILAEFLAVVGQGVAKTEGAEKGQAESRRVHESIRQEKVFAVVEQTDLDHVGEIYRAHPGLSYPDAVAASLALRSDEEILTYDRDLLEVVRRMGAAAVS